MEKVKMKIVDLDEHTNRNGIAILTIKAKSAGKIYTFSVKEDDYMDERSRKGFHQDWLKTIKKSMTRERQPKRDKVQKEKKIKEMMGVEVEEIVY